MLLARAKSFSCCCLRKQWWRVLLVSAAVNCYLRHIRSFKSFDFSVDCVCSFFCLSPVCILIAFFNVGRVLPRENSWRYQWSTSRVSKPQSRNGGYFQVKCRFFPLCLLTCLLFRSCVSCSERKIPLAEDRKTSESLGLEESSFLCPPYILSLQRTYPKILKSKSQNSFPLEFAFTQKKNPSCQLSVYLNGHETRYRRHDTLTRTLSTAMAIELTGCWKPLCRHVVPLSRERPECMKHLLLFIHLLDVSMSAFAYPFSLDFIHSPESIPLIFPFPKKEKKTDFL